MATRLYTSSKLWVSTAATVAMLCVGANISAQTDAAPAPQTAAPMKPAMFQAPPAGPAALADLVELISPAVVNIKVMTDNGETTTQGQGSGFIISPKGEVVTNYHVIDGGQTISIEFNNGEALPAKVIGTDAETDLALLQIQSRRQFPVVEFHQGDQIRIGDYVIAIGNPFGIGQSTSLGIISAIGRDTVDSGSYVDYIQTDATINTGNSGGPLFNPMGEVVGVNSAIYSPTGASVGIAFAIPHYTAQEVIANIRKYGEVQRGWLGAGLRTALYSQGDDNGVFKAGATVNNLFAGGPAQRQGLRVDDVILSINDQAVKNSVEATRVIGRLRPGQVANLVIERNDQMQNISIRIERRPEKDVVDQTIAVASSSPTVIPGSPSTGGATVADHGMSLVDLSSTFRDAIGMRPDQVGVYVESVLPGSGASRKGVKMGMVVLEANSQPVASVSTFGTIYRNAKQAGQSSITLKVRLDNGGESYVSLPVGG